MVQVFSHWFPGGALLRALLETFLLFLIAILVVIVANPEGFRDAAAGVPLLLLFSGTVLLINSALGLYQHGTRMRGVSAVARVTLSLILSIPIAYLLFEFLPKDGVPHELLEMMAVSAIASHAIIRGIATRAGRRKAVFSSRVLVVGTGPEAVAVRESIRKYGRDFQIVGYVAVPGTEVFSVPEGQVLKGAGPLVEAAREYRATQVVVAVAERRGGGLPLNELLECKLAGIQVLDLSSYFERVLGQLRLDSLRASWLIFGDGFRQGFLRTLVKRAFDIFASALLLTLASPVMLIAAIAIVIEDGFPLLYRQERVGQAGQIFKVIKFRSMRRDAERDGRPKWASANDSRVTRVGKLIRKLRIDELPQLINVLKGEMSLVGPRPERPFFVEQLSRDIPFYAARHSVKPGVTGWAQVRYPYGASVEDAVQKLQYDLYYVKNHTLFLDIIVFLETIEVVLTGRGAQ